MAVSFEVRLTNGQAEGDLRRYDPGEEIAGTATIVPDSDLRCDSISMSGSSGTPRGAATATRASLTGRYLPGDAGIWCAGHPRISLHAAAQSMELSPGTTSLSSGRFRSASTCPWRAIRCFTSRSCWRLGAKEVPHPNPLPEGEGGPARTWVAVTASGSRSVWNTSYSSAMVARRSSPKVAASHS